jgi:hypothetical protein
LVEKSNVESVEDYDTNDINNFLEDKISPLDEEEQARRIIAAEKQTAIPSLD